MWACGCAWVDVGVGGWTWCGCGLTSVWVCGLGGGRMGGGVITGVHRPAQAPAAMTTSAATGHGEALGNIMSTSAPTSPHVHPRLGVGVR